MTEDPSLLSEADSRQQWGGGVRFSAALPCGIAFPLRMRPLCSHALSDPGTGGLVPALFRCQGERRRRRWLDNSHGTFACGNPRAAELLKLGYAGCISNDIATNKAEAPWLRQVALRWRVMHGA